MRYLGLAIKHCKCFVHKPVVNPLFVSTYLRIGREAFPSMTPIVSCNRGRRGGKAQSPRMRLFRTNGLRGENPLGIDWVKRITE
jgi:hypothetical protein